MSPYPGLNRSVKNKLRSANSPRKRSSCSSQTASTAALSTASRVDMHPPRFVTVPEGASRSLSTRPALPPAKQPTDGRTAWREHPCPAKAKNGWCRPSVPSGESSNFPHNDARLDLAKRFLLKPFDGFHQVPGSTGVPCPTEDADFACCGNLRQRHLHNIRLLSLSFIPSCRLMLFSRSNGLA